MVIGFGRKFYRRRKGYILYALLYSSISNLLFGRINMKG